MNDRHNDVARTRWFILSLSRLFGVALVILGLLVHQGAIAWPVELGYALIAIGIIDVFVIPQVLARRWRSPKE